MIETTHTRSPEAGIDAGADSLDVELAGLVEDARRLAFPSADLVHAAAALFPVPARRQGVGFGRVLERTWSESAQEWQEGSWPVLEVGPGMVRFRRRDAGAFDRRREREHDAGAKAWRSRAQELRLLRMPAALSPLFDAEALDAGEVVQRYRDRITEWSRRSQANLIRSILSLDLAGLLAGGKVPVMVTLTLPGSWLEVAPDGAQARRLFERFRARWARKWGAPSWIWKREFQERGAPHWHVWVVPPTDDLAGFRSWVAENWTASLRLTDPQEERWSLRRGSHLSIKEGLRASDPKRLALYFLKESGPSAVKAYQNRVPEEWAGEVVGRFWGVAGIERVVAEVELDPAVMDHVWRLLRRERERSAGVRKVEVQRVDSRTGVVRTRRVNRRFKVRQSSGWVAVNDAPAFVAGLVARLRERGIFEPHPS